MPTKAQTQATQLKRALNNATYQITDQALLLSYEDRVVFMDTLVEWAKIQLAEYGADYQDRKASGDI